MSEQLPDRFILGWRASRKDVYHTGRCRSVTHSNSETRPVDDDLIDHHEYELCRFCSGFEPSCGVGADD